MSELKTKRVRRKSKVRRGKGLLNTIINKLPFEMHYISPFTGRRANFCGPGTSLKNRLNPDGTPKDWSKPVSKADALALQHDLDYDKYNGNSQEDFKSRQESDRRMIAGLKDIYKNPKEKWHERGDAFLISLPMRLKNRLGWGSKRKIERRGDSRYCARCDKNVSSSNYKRHCETKRHLQKRR